MKIEREHFVTCGQMKLLEERADADGLTYYQMMENAGTRAAEIILDRMAYKAALKEEKLNDRSSEHFKAAEKIIKQLPAGKEELFAKHLEKSIRSVNNDVSALLFCGKGNNGGDGFVVARLLHDAGYRVTVVLVDGKPKTTDAITNFDMLKDLPIRILDMSSNPRTLMELKEVPDIVIDAIYGTGFHGKLESNALKAAIYINRYSKVVCDEAAEAADNKTDDTTVFALDIPSGMGGDLTSEKKLNRSSIAAHYTITFHAKKPVHLQKFAKNYCGEIIIADIGIDEKKLWEVEL